jgi:hypothetical protein
LALPPIQSLTPGTPSLRWPTTSPYAKSPRVPVPTNAPSPAILGLDPSLSHAGDSGRPRIIVSVPEHVGVRATLEVNRPPRISRSRHSPRCCSWRGTYARSLDGIHGALADVAGKKLGRKSSVVNSRQGASSCPLMSCANLKEIPLEKI